MPSAIKYKVELNDGTRVIVRPLVPSDARDFLDAFSSLSPVAKRQRFLGGIGNLSSEQLHYLTHADGRNHIALCMYTDPEVSSPPSDIGLARCVRLIDDPGNAEVAVTVLDDWQGRGAGTLLLRLLAMTSWAEGIRYWQGEMFADNKAISALMAREFTMVDCRLAGAGVVEVVYAIEGCRSRYHTQVLPEVG